MSVDGSWRPVQTGVEMSLCVWNQSTLKMFCTKTTFPLHLSDSLWLKHLGPYLVSILPGIYRGPIHSPWLGGGGKVDYLIRFSPSRQTTEAGRLVWQPFAIVDFIPQKGTKNLATVFFFFLSPYCCLENDTEANFKQSPPPFLLLPLIRMLHCYRGASVPLPPPPYGPQWFVIFRINTRVDSDCTICTSTCTQV